MKMSHKKKLLDAENADHDKHDDDHDDEGCCTNGFYDSYLRPCFAEFIASLMFTFITGMAAMTADPPTMAAATGFAVIVLAIMFAPVSGGHFNPAVTLAVLIAGHISAFKAFFYVLFQLIGAVAGSAIVLGLADDADYNDADAGVPMVIGDLSIYEALALEAMLGFILILVIMVAQVDQDNALAPIAHGMVYLVGLLFATDQTGGVINPLRSLGPSVMWSIDETDHWKEQWIYYAAAFASAAIAAIAYKLNLASDDKRWNCSEGRKHKD